eukprot:snap_masked-scaffold_1-processed-gene-2.34-mRNA-1 protein AED:1.00 eAED:1.00 QI:0/0/0/0/1/1/2/0/111
MVNNATIFLRYQISNFELFAAQLEALSFTLSFGSIIMNKKVKEVFVDKIKRRQKRIKIRGKILRKHCKRENNPYSILKALILLLNATFRIIDVQSNDAKTKNFVNSELIAA